MEFTAFDKQGPVLLDDFRVKGAFAGKRGGKTEVGAIWGLDQHENGRAFHSNGIDPNLGIICAPTEDMLKRLSWKKFQAYARPFIKKQIQKPKEITWHDSEEKQESLIYGISAEKPERLEGVKASWIWIDEVFQVKEQFFLECLARLADCQGYLLCTGSLGVQFVNPKSHWAYKYFKESTLDGFMCYEWATEDNPHFPKDELERQKGILDAETYDALYRIRWDAKPKTAVYADFTDDNVIKDIPYVEGLETSICVDWGFAHPMACGVFQYDKKNDVVYMIDEWVKSKKLLEDLHSWIISRPYKIDNWYCDIAGNQEREQSGISNIKWFKKRGIHFKFCSRKISRTIPIVRSFIKNAEGRRRFFVSSRCTESIAGLRRYKYPEKDGIITSELPLKEDDDAVDMIRYYYMNRHDIFKHELPAQTFRR